MSYRRKSKLQNNAQNFILKLRDEVMSVVDAPTEKRRLAALHTEVEHHHGPMEAELNSDEAVVLCVVKDGESLVGAFVKHYLALGFKHLFFLDNGSTDRTIKILSAYNQTTVVSSAKPFGEYYVTFKNFLIQAFGQGKWCLVADIDEFLHFPLNQRLSDVLAYLNRYNYSAVCVQMLDMFSKKGIALSKHQAIWTLEHLRSTFCYYDLSGIDRKKYVRRLQSRVHSGLNFLYGGIRKTAFNRDCFLTKEVLFRVSGGTCLKSSHLLHRSRIADFSAVFLHYKFIEDFYAAAVEAVAQENHWRKSHEYKAYLTVLAQATSAESEGDREKESVFSLFQPSSLLLKEIDDLIDHNFLFVSDEFRTFCSSACGSRR
ncbi:MAG: glycosyltransferase family 2 protein [Phormidesmis sp.]